jgi:hypothetical protein
MVARRVVCRPASEAALVEVRSSSKRSLSVAMGRDRLLIREEEVPREGVVVRRTYQAARWHDGRLFVWSGDRSSTGRGEASSGLAFDG